jgi:hypothetical protein
MTDRTTRRVAGPEQGPATERRNGMLEETQP